MYALFGTTFVFIPTLFGILGMDAVGLKWVYLNEITADRHETDNENPFEA